MYVTALFTKNGVPKTGLSPTVAILRLSDDTVVIPAGAMAASAQVGYYVYDFSAFDDAEEYTFVADGGITLYGSERYKHGDSIGANILADSASIDGRLPTDPADESLQQASHTQTQAAVATRAAPGDAMDLIAGAVDAAAIATDAIDADAIATDAVTEIQAGLATATAVSTIASGVTRLLGLSHENSFLDSTVFDASDQLLSARLRCFNSKVNADLATDGGSEATGLLATYQITAVYEAAGGLRDYRVTLESP